MTTIYVLYHKFWEESSDHGQNIVCDVVTFNATDDQRWTVIMVHIWVFIWKVAHIVET